mgnify:FL=1
MVGLKVLSLAVVAGLLILKGEKIMVEHGFYIIDDLFFEKFNDPFLKGNKSENRPHYYCFKDTNEGLYWIIPLSSRINKYQKIINQRLKNHKPCDILHICTLSNGKQSVFLIQDMFPITQKYIKRKYTINSNHLILKNQNEIRIIEQKAERILNQINRGKHCIPTCADVLSIKRELLLELQTETQMTTI